MQRPDTASHAVLAYGLYHTAPRNSPPISGHQPSFATLGVGLDKISLQHAVKFHSTNRWKCSPAQCLQFQTQLFNWVISLWPLMELKSSIILTICWAVLSRWTFNRQSFCSGFQPANWAHSSNSSNHLSNPLSSILMFSPVNTSRGPCSRLPLACTSKIYICFLRYCSIDLMTSVCSFVARAASARAVIFREFKSSHFAVSSSIRSCRLSVVAVAVSATQHNGSFPVLVLGPQLSDKLFRALFQASLLSHSAPRRTFQAPLRWILTHGKLIATLNLCLNWHWRYHTHSSAPYRTPFSQREKIA